MLYSAGNAGLNADSLFAFMNVDYMGKGVLSTKQLGLLHSLLGSIVSTYLPFTVFTQHSAIEAWSIYIYYLPQWVCCLYAFLTKYPYLLG